MNIEIINLTKSPIERDFLQKISKNILKILGQNQKTEISLAIVGQNRMRSLNKKYREENQVTDVLVFANFVQEPLQNFLGEIIICYPQAKKQAKRFGHSLRKELTILLIHAILHLVGYDDKTEDNRKKMEAKQEEILNSLDI
mgnify:CR=1 FL=1